MELFTFTGDWSPYVQIPAFNEFRFTDDPNAPSKNPGVRQIQLQIEDEETLDPDPHPEQLVAINHLLLHQYTIAHKLLPAIFDRYAAYEDYYDGMVRDNYRPLKSPEPLRNMFEITRAEIKVEQRDGFAYVGLYGNCSWFGGAGYGIGILLHKDRIIAAEEDRDFAEEMKKDGGHKCTASYTTDYFAEIPSRKKLYLYSPHPKYGTLKPWQQRNNNEYPYLLIENRKNEDFILDIELGFLSVNHKIERIPDSSWHYASREYEGVTLLEYAHRYKNEELVQFLLSKTS